jgi:hypothetical protein
MRILLQRLKRVEHAIFGNIGMGAITTVAGLFQGNIAMMSAGIGWLLVATAVLVVVRVTEPVLEGVVVGLQPQLASRPNRAETDDVQLHMQRTPELPKAA